MIERSFLKPVKITLKGEDRWIPTFEAIIRLISHKALSGDRRAVAALMKYEEFAAQYRERKVRIVFVDNAYTQAVASQPSKIGKADE
jgi:hypothetical protein